MAVAVTAWSDEVLCLFLMPPLIRRGVVWRYFVSGAGCWVRFFFFFFLAW
jgi:hypothetical protein